MTIDILYCSGPRGGVAGLATLKIPCDDDDDDDNEIMMMQMFKVKS